MMWYDWFNEEPDLKGELGSLEEEKIFVTYVFLEGHV